MGLFQKKINTGLHMPLYSLSANKTVLIVGLGNPGKGYDGTRHNVGFAALDAFAAANDFPAWQDKKDLKCLLTSHILTDTKVILIKPTTFMNLSGEAVKAVQHFYKLTNAQTLVVHDELDIPFGQIRSKTGGGTAGHNGVKSLVEHCGEDFMRLRVGIGPKLPPEIDSADFVLAKFSENQKKSEAALLNEVGVIITEYLASDHLPAETRSFL